MKGCKTRTHSSVDKDISHDLLAVGTGQAHPPVEVVGPVERRFGGGHGTVEGYQVQIL